MRKFKKRRKKLYTRKIFLLNSILVVFLFLGIGYSLLSTTLIIGGNLTVKEYLQPTLYNVLKKETISGGLAKEYTEEHQDSMDASLSTEKIYHWYANNNEEGATIQNKNNVIFADHCWQMIRTTDTGGVKLIYNGEPENNQCLSTRSTHVGYNGRSTLSLSSNYYYGTSYTYDSDNKFKLSGELSLARWDSSTSENLVGKYTCRNSSADGTCSTLYYIESALSNVSANVLAIDDSSKYAFYGTQTYNKGTNDSPATVGYMYNKEYHSVNKDGSKSLSLGTSNTANLLNHQTIMIADEVEWNPTDRKYYLINPYNSNEITDYDDYYGKYTFGSSNTSGTVARYIMSASSTGYSYYKLEKGANLDYLNTFYAYGDSYVDNGDGTYTIENAASFKRVEFWNEYQNISKKYFCELNSDNKCINMMYSYYPSKMGTEYVEPIDGLYKFGNSFRYENGKYILQDTTEIWDIIDDNQRNSIGNHHYTCWNVSGECSSVDYVYGVLRMGYGGYSNYIYSYQYITLENGNGVGDALIEMLSAPDVNKYNSVMKTAVEAWYERYMTNYSDYIENDIIYCSNRSIKGLAGWNPNGTQYSITSQLTYNSSTLSCSNITDQFSLINPSAKLKYPVGLATRHELSIMGDNSVRKSASVYWTQSPRYFYGNNTAITPMFYVDTYGKIETSQDTMGGYWGVRPVITIKPKTKYSSGDGSMASPYIVDAEAHQYVYSTSDEKTRGVLVSELGSTYKTETEAINGFNKRVVLNHRIENDRVASSGVTFERNGIIYTLYGEGSTYNDSTGDYNDDSIYYEENKQTLKNAFGEDKCTEYTTPEKYYECTDGNEIGAARASGRVGVEIDTWYCRDFPDGTFHCKQY